MTIQSSLRKMHSEQPIFPSYPNPVTGKGHNIPQTYLGVVSAHRTRTFKRTIWVAFMFIWVAKVSHFIIPGLYMKSWRPVSIRKKINKKIWQNMNPILKNGLVKTKTHLQNCRCYDMTLDFVVLQLFSARQQASECIQ